MSKDVSNEFDPFRVVVSFASEVDSADIFIETFTGIGLTFDICLVGDDNFSHGNRIRALCPRVLKAYESLSPEGKLAAADAAVGRFLSRIRQLQRVPSFTWLPDKLLDAFQRIGWGLQEDRLVTLTPKTREMFFPKDSQWDAFVAIREVIDQAQNELMLVDPFCDRAFFGILQSSTGHPKVVRLLCRNGATALKAEATAFCAQHSSMSIEIRTSSDFHDRFLVVDQTTCIHIGASINHAGSRAFMISAVEDKAVREVIIKVVNEAWKFGVPVSA